MADPTLQIIVKMKDMFSKQLDAVHKTVTKNTSKMRTAFSKMGAAVSSLKGKIGLLIGAWVSWRGVTAAWSAVKTYGKLASVTDAFETLRKGLGINADALDRWRKVLAATVGDSDILTQVNKAIHSGFVKTAEDFEVVAYNARIYARLLGQDVLPALEQMVQSIAAASPRALNVLGLNIEELFRRAQAVTGKPLEQAEKQQIMLNALREKMLSQLNKTEDLQTTIAEKVQQTSVHWGNVQENIGKAFSKMSDLGEVISKTAEDFSGKHAEGFAKGFEFIVKRTDDVLTGWTLIGKEIGKAIGQIEMAAQGIEPLLGKDRRPKLPPVTEEDVLRVAGRLAEWQGPPWIQDQVHEMEEVVVTAQQSLCDKLQMHAINTAKAIGGGVSFIAEKSADAFNAFWGAPGQRDKEGALIGMGGGVIGGVEAYGEEVKDVALNIAEGVQDIFRAMEDNISDFFFDAMMGKLKTFKDYLRAFLQSIARIMSQVFAKIAMAGIGGALGLPGFTTPTPVGEKQKGGIVTRPELTWIGEGGRAEAVVPLPDNRSIPVKFSGGGTGAPVTVNFNVQTIDSTSFAAWLQRSKTQIQAIISEAAGRDPQFRAGFRAI